MDERHPLRRWRETQDPPLTQDEAGSRLDVPGNTLARWERREVLPQRRHREKIAEVAGIPEMEILLAYGRASAPEAAQ